MKRAPNLFIVGAPKSGTTSLYEYLKGHPQVFLTPVKEPCYFSADLALDKSGNFLRYGEDEARYFALFDDAGDRKYAGEASTRYLFSNDAPRLIKGASPDARVIAMLRNPVDMIHSLHAHKLAAGTEDITDFGAALDAEDDRRAGRQIPEYSNPKLATYRERALFGEQVERWMATFGRDRVHVIVFEEFAADPAGALRRTLEFLGIDPSYRPESFAAHNVAHGARSPILRRVFNSRPVQWVAWKALPRLLGDTRTRSLVRRVSQSGVSRRPVTREKVDPVLRRSLEDYYAADVARLSQLLGRDMAAFWFSRG